MTIVTVVVVVKEGGLEALVHICPLHISRTYIWLLAPYITAVRVYSSGCGSSSVQSVTYLN